ncbi:MAG: Kiwa anti-phage protein KwaB-like domain-containing protein [Candidatus Ornithospirochaeta sp.]
MADIVKNITDARDTGTINVYAVSYNGQKKNKNYAVALPGNLNDDFRDGFCENIVNYQNANEVVFNPVSNGLEDDTYEYVPLLNVQEKWKEIQGLLDNALDYCGKKNRKLVPLSNLYVCALDYNLRRYYLCAKQGNSSDKILKGKSVLFWQQDELKTTSPSDVFIIGFYVGFLIDETENKVLIFDKKSFQNVFKYDDYQKEMVKNNLNIIDQWSFLSTSDLIKSKHAQKNVYRNLAKVFADQNYLNQIRKTNPAQLKSNLISRTSGAFTNEDFDGDKLKVTSGNIDKFMKMLAKGFKYNFFEDVAE